MIVSDCACEGSELWSAPPAIAPEACEAEDGKWSLLDGGTIAPGGLYHCCCWDMPVAGGGCATGGGMVGGCDGFGGCVTGGLGFEGGDVLLLFRRRNIHSATRRAITPMPPTPTPIPMPALAPELRPPESESEFEFEFEEEPEPEPSEV